MAPRISTGSIVVRRRSTRGTQYCAATWRTMEDLPTPRVPHSIEARRRSVGSAYCSISAALAPEIEIGGIFIGLLIIDHPVVSAGPDVVRRSPHLGQRPRL